LIAFDNYASRPSTLIAFYLATALTDAEDEQHWNWKLRPEVSNAIEVLGLDA
jgi:hypothetical protein